MKKTVILATALSLFISGAALANTQDKEGTKTEHTTCTAKNHKCGNHQAITATTAEGVQKLAKDTRVKLSGYIIKSESENKYQFKDDTGTLTVNIDRHNWGSLSMNPEEKVEIYGKVEKKADSVIVDVKRIAKEK
ncbi:NirD/YgiW/YdeI family stress tolerance protein [Utexia brackfieldae]|uniref:YgiW/YdeI family stress tolerance OB fold protein n=1 Tax=Utexia brackfieldae TaxID=3074108 RepID=UPI00370D8E3C